VVPQTREQRKKLDQINSDVRNIDKRIKKSIEDFDKNCTEKQGLDIKHELCQNVLQIIGPQQDLSAGLF
jgi:hypothetical protein